MKKEADARTETGPEVMIIYDNCTNNIGKQRRLRQACMSVQSVSPELSLHTLYMELEKKTKFDDKAETDARS